MVEFVENSLAGGCHVSKLIDGYSGQNPNESGNKWKDLVDIPLIGFGRLSEKKEDGQVPEDLKMVGDAWIARIFFAETPKLLLPAASLRNAHTAGTMYDQDKAWSPEDIEAFLERPEDFMHTKVSEWQGWKAACPCVDSSD